MPQPFTVEDLALYRDIGAVHAAGAHDLAVFAVQSADLEADCSRSAIWCVRLAGGEPRALTHGRAHDQAPRVSPDGRRVAFLSDREGGAPQVHVIETSGGEARRLGHFARGALGLEWSPDGRQLLVRAAIAVDPEARGARATAAVPARAAAAAQLLWRLPCEREGEDYTLDREVHLFALDLARAEARRLTDGAFDVDAACWSPDGQQIAYTRSCQGRLGAQVDLWVAASDGSAARRVSEHVAQAAHPAWSPDGRRIAFTGIDRQRGDTARRLWLHDLEQGGVAALGAEDLELAGHEPPHWQDDGQGLVAVLAVRGLQQVTEIALPGGQRRVLVDGERHVANLALARGYLVYTAETAAAPRELFASDLDGRYEVPLTTLNAWTMERPEPQAERRRFAVPDGDGGIETVDGWVLRPAGAGREATPWLVDLHDGAGGWVPLAFEAHPYWSVLVARGWSVLALDAVGAGGYGPEFAARLRGRSGAIDLPQHLAALDQLQREGLADSRIALAGRAYGGRLAAWAIGRSERFRAAVLQAPDLEHGAALPAILAAPEPAARAPTLILQGREDRRCPALHTQALFAAWLQGPGEAACEMVLYPGAGHAVFERSRPSQRIDATRRLVDWLERWIGAPPADALPAEDAPPQAVPADAAAVPAPRRRRSRMRGEIEPAH